jgi:hypothetical protein
MDAGVLGPVVVGPGKHPPAPSAPSGASGVALAQRPGPAVLVGAEVGTELVGAEVGAELVGAELVGAVLLGLEVTVLVTVAVAVAVAVTKAVT